MVRKSARSVNQTITNQYVVNEEYLRELIEQDNDFEPYPELLPSEKAQLESDNENDASMFTVEKILDKRKEGRRIFYLVKWEGYAEDQATWEPLSNLQNVKELLKEFDRQFELGVMNNNSTNVSVNPNNSTNNDNDRNMEFTQDNDEMQYMVQRNSHDKLIPISSKSKSIKKGWSKKFEKQHSQYDAISVNQTLEKHSCVKTEPLSQKIKAKKQGSKSQEIIEDTEEQIKILNKQKEIIKQQQYQIEEQLQILEQIKQHNKIRQLSLQCGIKSNTNNVDTQVSPEKSRSQAKLTKTKNLTYKRGKQSVLKQISQQQQTDGLGQSDLMAKANPKKPGRKKKNAIVNDTTNEAQTNQDQSEQFDPTCCEINTEEINELVQDELPQEGVLEFDTPVSIKSAKMINGQINIVIEWQVRKNGFKPLESMITNDQAKQKCPNLLVDFYESKISSIKSQNVTTADQQKDNQKYSKQIQNPEQEQISKS
ncbi:m-phase phosphoprotein 8 [Stylonychia lemnae]|uniref:M-phase phosphoprotein 8 n=1 Tax=Stylonychia lemnae TaxID=5949 RepID=A0A077ZU69_STYLE|nr:m-phase phosphoprotein 8 [Stylonychia lemnae]|eukprot:CDW72830.1 m-phase phosphoprotein 8 [Stylonychia lemnae]